jgi:hypothetical protein
MLNSRLSCAPKPVGVHICQVLETGCNSSAAPFAGWRSGILPRFVMPLQAKRQVEKTSLTDYFS